MSKNPRLTASASPSPDGEPDWATEMDRHSIPIIAALNSASPQPSSKFGEHVMMQNHLLMTMSKRVLRTMRARNPEEAAEDVVQRFHEKMLSRGYRAYIARAAGRPFAKYAFVALRNLCRDVVRRDRRRHSCDWEVDESGQNPVMAAERRELCDEVWRILKHLPATQRYTLYLADWDGMTSKEIATLLAITEGAVNCAKHRARDAFRKKLSGDYWPLDDKP